MSSRMDMSEQKVESYLRDIPEGLFPRHMLMTDEEKEKIVVRRLEQLFTGKISGRHVRRNQTINPSKNPAQEGTLAPTVTEAASGPQCQMDHQPPNIQQPPVLQPPSLQQATVPSTAKFSTAARSRQRALPRGSHFTAGAADGIREEESIERQCVYITLGW